MTRRTRILALTAGLSVFLVLAGTAASWASWTASSAVSGTATSTSASVSLSAGSTLTTSYSSTSTGPVIGVLTLGDTGGAPLSLALAASSSNASLSGAISLRLWLQSGGSCGSTVPGSGVTTGTLAAIPALPSGAASVAAGGSAVVCAATSLTGAVSGYSGQSTAVILTLTGSVGTAWRPTATAGFTQSVVTVTPSFSCTNNTGSATINWPNTATANTGTVYRSKINGSYPSALADRSWYYREYANQGLSGTGLPSVAGTYPWIIEETTNGVTTTAYAGTVQVQYYAPWGAWVLQCGS